MRGGRTDGHMNGNSLIIRINIAYPISTRVELPGHCWDEITARSNFSHAEAIWKATSVCTRSAYLLKLKISP